MWRISLYVFNFSDRIEKKGLVKRDLVSGIYDMPTLLPQMMGFGSYFLQTSLGKILNQLHSKRLDEVAEQFESHRELMSPSTADSEGTEGTEGKESPAPADPQGLDAVRRILETVNTSVTKQLLEANVRKLSTSPATMKREFEEDYQVRLSIWYWFHFPRRASADVYYHAMIRTDRGRIVYRLPIMSEYRSSRDTFNFSKLSFLPFICLARNMFLSLSLSFSRWSSEWDEEKLIFSETIPIYFIRIIVFFI